MLHNEPSIRAVAGLSIFNFQLECIIIKEKILKTRLTDMLKVISEAEEVEISLIHTNPEFHRKAVAREVPPGKKCPRG